MKFDELRSIAHNLADSLASGCSFLMGVYELDVFGAARASAHGSMTVDFLSGTCVDGPASPQLTEAMKLSRNALSTLCQKHGTTQAAFRELTVRYWIDGVQPAFSVTVEDQSGHRQTDEYRGIPGRRAKVLDPLGRIRSLPGQRNPPSGSL